MLAGILLRLDREVWTEHDDETISALDPASGRRFHVRLDDWAAITRRLASSYKTIHEALPAAALASTDTNRAAYWTTDEYARSVIIWEDRTDDEPQPPAT